MAMQLSSACLHAKKAALGAGKMPRGSKTKRISEGARPANDRSIGLTTTKAHHAARSTSRLAKECHGILPVNEPDMGNMNRRLLPRHVAKASESSPNASVSTDSSALKERLITGGFIALWYAVNVAFNLTNKSLFKHFPYPWTVSTVHVIIGTIYCAITYFAGWKSASFGRPITKKEFGQIFPPASMHALGHIAANLSFAAVAISLTHTVKTLEPVFSAGLQWLIMGQATPLPVLASLVPIIGGVAMAVCGELSFNMMGFAGAMISNITFGLRAVLSKKTMNTLTDLSSTALYAYTTLISMLICLPLALIVEGPTLKAGAEAAIESIGAQKFYLYLVAVGMFYHLYNQFAFNTLQRVNPVSHGVCNVVKRIIIIGSSVVFFGNVLTRQTMIGTVIAIAGTAVYTELQSRRKAKK